MSQAGLPAASWVMPGLCSQSPSVPQLPGHPTRAEPRGCSPPVPLGSVSGRLVPWRGPCRCIRSPIRKRRKRGAKGARRPRGGSACGDARPVPPALKSWAFAAAQTGVWRGVFFWKKQKLANGSGWFRVRRGGVSSRFEGILCSRNRKEAGRDRQASRGGGRMAHGEHLPPGIAARPRDYTSPS